MEEPGPFLCKSSDQDLSFLGQASMGIKNEFKRKNHLEKSNSYKKYNKIQR